MLGHVDIYDSYDDLNRELSRWTGPGIPEFSNDINAEDPAFIIGIRKQSYEGLDPPDMTRYGFAFIEHVKVGDKYDIYIYER